MKVTIRLLIYLGIMLLFFACVKKNVKADTIATTPSPIPIIDVKTDHPETASATAPIKDTNTKDYLAFDEKIVKVTGVARAQTVAVKMDTSPQALTIHTLHQNDRIKVLGKVVLDEQEGFQKTTGIVIENNIRIRNKPKLNGKIIDLLKEGQQVDVLDQSPEPVIIDHAKEHWYFITTKTIPKGGWIFGKYLKRNPHSNIWYQVTFPAKKNGWIESRLISLEFQFVFKNQKITFFQSHSATLPINLQSTNLASFDYNMQDLFEIDTHDLTVVNKLGRERDLNASMQQLKTMIETAYTRFLIFERTRLIDSPCAWTGASPEEIYTRFKTGLTDGTFWQALPPVISIGLTNTGFYAHMNSRLLCARYNLNLNQDFFISEPVLKSDGAAFFVQGISFEYTSSADSEVIYKDNAIFFIDKIENSIFPRLNGRYEITFISLSNCNLVDDYEIYYKLHIIHNLKFITEHKLDYFKGALYGIYDKVRYFPN